MPKKYPNNEIWNSWWQENCSTPPSPPPLFWIFISSPHLNMMPKIYSLPYIVGEWHHEFFERAILNTHFESWTFSLLIYLVLKVERLHQYNYQTTNIKLYDDLGSCLSLYSFVCIFELYEFYIIILALWCQRCMIQKR